MCLIAGTPYDSRIATLSGRDLSNTKITKQCLHTDNDTKLHNSDVNIFFQTHTAELKWTSCKSMFLMGKHIHRKWTF